MKILIYEDSGYKNLFPLNMLRASYEIRCGANSILERVESIAGKKSEIVLHCRNILSEYLKESFDRKINFISKDDYLLLNGRVVFTDKSIKQFISHRQGNTVFKTKAGVIAAFIPRENFQMLKSKVENPDDNIFGDGFFEDKTFEKIILKDEFNAKVINHPWDSIDYILHGGLETDFDYFKRLNRRFKSVRKEKNFINPERISISKKVKIYPGVVLDASEGDIFIDEKTFIEPFTFIKGPVYIGKNCLVKSGAKIYGPVVIGEKSKVAGEIAESVFHSFVNKQHDGFVGHSYICPFVNLGAGTVTSDLKNNYSKIRMKSGNEEINSGMQFLGSIIGDHSKTSINTMLNTGSIIGIFANIFGAGFPEKEIKSFSWCNAGSDSKRYDIDKAINTAKIVMDRRGISMSKAYEKLVRSY